MLQIDTKSQTAVLSGISDGGSALQGGASVYIIEAAAERIFCSVCSASNSACMGCGQEKYEEEQGELYISASLRGWIPVLRVDQ